MREALDKEREQANANAQAAIASLKQARTDLQRLFEEKEETVKENRKLIELIEGQKGNASKNSLTLVTSISNTPRGNGNLKLPPNYHANVFSSANRENIQPPMPSSESAHFNPNTENDLTLMIRDYKSENFKFS